MPTAHIQLVPGTSVPPTHCVIGCPPELRPAIEAACSEPPSVERAAGVTWVTMHRGDAVTALQGLGVAPEVVEQLRDGAAPDGQFWLVMVSGASQH
jgi:hypothetical protein